MAKVYLALVVGPAGVNKLTVIKVIQNERLTNSEGGLALFWDEARLSTRLVHPNIVHTYDVGQIDGHYFLALEYLDGQTYRLLRARAAQHALPLHETLRILSEVARGLHYAHELRDFHGKPLGVVHRDVSPQNIFVTYDGQVKLIDFGIAKTHDADHQTRIGLIRGKLNYIAPEQLRGDALDRRADLFALGVLLWEAVAGRRFAGGPEVAEVAKVQTRIRGEEPNVRAVKPGVSEELATIIDSALALDREQRFADAAAFADALDSFIERSGQRPSAKTLSTWMNSMFGQERAALHKVIEERVQSRLRASPEPAANDLPVLPIAAAAHTGTRLSKTPRSAAPSGRPADHRSWVSWDRSQLGWAAAGLGITVVSAIVTAALLSPATSVDTAAGSAEPALQSGARQAQERVASRSLAAAPPLDALRAPSNANLILAVSPPHAELWIDGAPVTAPFKGEFLRGAALHRIEAAAPGYRPFVRLVPFNQDRRLNIALEPLAGEAKRGAARATAGSQLAANGRRVSGSLPAATEATEARSEPPAGLLGLVPGSDIRPIETRLSRSQIDTADPYAK
jgi:serine/threonine protein kinase